MLAALTFTTLGFTATLLTQLLILCSVSFTPFQLKIQGLNSYKALAFPGELLVLISLAE